MKLLVIEDSTDVRLLLELELAREGYAVVAADSGESGLHLAARERPALILSDLGLPDMDGLDLPRRLRADPVLRDTPAIALSGFGSWGEIEAARSAGYAAVLIKPVGIRELTKTIQQVGGSRPGNTP
jgi:two-component system, chemotaxis family, CheB/CheR fusion protein